MTKEKDAASVILSEASVILSEASVILSKAKDLNDTPKTPRPLE